MTNEEWEKQTQSISSIVPNMQDMPYLPSIKGIDILKKDESASDIEQTVSGMYDIVRNMESQLNRVISINKLLEMDLKEAKAMIAELKEDRANLKGQLKVAEDEMPSKRELTAEIEHLIDERNTAQLIIHDSNIKVREMEQTKLDLDHVKELEETQKGMIEEIGFLEGRLKKTIDVLDSVQKENTMLQGEKAAQMDRIINLEKDLAQTLEENDMLIRELSKSQAMLSDIRSKFSNMDLDGLQGI